MVETITPAGCGSRHRQRTAIALFAAGAVAAAAALGVLLGLLGAPLDRTAALAAAAALALVGALRELGVLGLPLPQLARQVPERWRRELPLPLWSAGYGAALGLGLLTHQAVATFWVAAAGALALGDPAAAAACLGCFGLGRALMVILPARAGRDPGDAVLRLAARRAALGPANAGVLALLAALLVAAAPAAGAPAGAAAAGAYGVYDPAASGRVVAHAVAVPGAPPAVWVLPPGLPGVRFDGARSPALDGDLVAYADDGGIRVVDWRTGREQARIPGAVSKPALEWPYIAYVRTQPGGLRLELLNARTGASSVVDSGHGRVDVGRPALWGGLIAWHRAAGRRSVILLRPILGRGRRVIARSVTGLQINPSLAQGQVLWVEQTGLSSYLRLRGIGGGRVRTLLTQRGPGRFLWTTALADRTAYATRWDPSTGRAEILARRWR